MVLTLLHPVEVLGPLGFSKDVQHEALVARAGENHFFSAFAGRTRERLIAALEFLELDPGDMIFRQGDLPDGVYLVISGAVQLDCKAADGDVMVIATIEAGDFFGEMSMLDGAGRSTNARAAGPLTMGRIAADELFEILAAEPGRCAMALFKRVLERLRMANEKYVEEVRRKEKLETIGTMAATITHDIKSPVTGIQLVADLISKRHEDAKTREYCGMIRKQATRVVGMAQELLDFSRGISELRRERASILSLAAEYEELVRDDLKRAGVVWSVEADPVCVEVDRDRFIRVLQNLVGNAVEALAGRSDGRIRLRGRRTTEGRVTIEIEDNGPGVPEPIRETLFEPFVTHGKRRGTGLGMSITRNIVTAHGGTITFVTETGKGTTFRIELPEAG